MLPVRRLGPSIIVYCDTVTCLIVKKVVLDFPIVQTCCNLAVLRAGLLGGIVTLFGGVVVLLVATASRIGG
jgi:hypothetical protein